jgi:hypothetical protein
MIPKSVAEIADAWWCRDFGCTPAELRPAATHVQVHAGELVDNPGIWILLVGEFPLVSLPPAYAEVLSARARKWSRSTVMNEVTLRNELQGAVDARIIGPAFIGYTTEGSFVPSTHPAARALISTDVALVDALRASCTAQEWEHGGSAFGVVPTFGAFSNDRLAALAGYKVWGGTIAHVSVVCNPALRGHGFGKAVVAAATGAALDAGLLPQYRTLALNVPSMRIARALGFEEYGYSVYFRLGEGK